MQIRSSLRGEEASEMARGIMGQLDASMPHADEAFTKEKIEGFRDGIRLSLEHKAVYFLYLKADGKSRGEALWPGGYEEWEKL